MASGHLPTSSKSSPSLGTGGTVVRRGRLKVFLGYASRVGKSFRMMDEGRRRFERGQDVIIGATQAEIAPEVEALIRHLEVVPTRNQAHGGRSYQSLDLQAICRRHPGICLVDELAYDNPPDSRHPRRWQDVEELLAAGIGVITAVNLQHIEDQLDAVERITGKRAEQTIPGAFLRAADEIVLVDAAPDDLAVRPGVPASDDGRRMTELRELALRVAAGIVEKQLHDYLESNGLPPTWGTHERILVCLAPGSDAVHMLSSGRRNANRFHGDLLACYLQQSGLSPFDDEAIQAHLRLARELGASVHILNGSDFVDTILDFARAQRVTQIFIGHMRPGRRFSRTPIERLIDRAVEFDVRLFPHREHRT